MGGPTGRPRRDGMTRGAHRRTRDDGACTVYAPAVSDKPPQTYILHTVILFVVLVGLMVLFLHHQWG
jgi:hypothetical protein